MCAPLSHASLLDVLCVPARLVPEMQECSDGVHGVALVVYVKCDSPDG